MSSPEDVDIGERAYTCYQGYDDDRVSAENGLEKNPYITYPSLNGDIIV
jgi:hypothetical protein